MFLLLRRNDDVVCSVVWMSLPSISKKSLFRCALITTSAYMCSHLNQQTAILAQTFPTGVNWHSESLGGQFSPCCFFELPDPGTATRILLSANDITTRYCLCLILKVPPLTTNLLINGCLPPILAESSFHFERTPVRQNCKMLLTPDVIRCVTSIACSPALCN